MRAQTVLLILSAALLSGCGIKGPLQPPPSRSAAPAATLVAAADHSKAAGFAAVAIELHSC